MSAIDRRPLLIACLITGLVAAILAVGHVDAVSTGAALLTGFWFLLSAAAGCLGWMLVLTVQRPAWAQPVRRWWQAGWVLWVPVGLFAAVTAWFIPDLFPWAGAGGAPDPAVAEVLERRQAWHGAWPLALRTAGLLSAGLLAAWFLRQGDRPRAAAVTLPLMAVAFFVLSLDWLLAITPMFHSTLFSLIQLLAGVQVAHAAVVLIAWWLVRRGRLDLSGDQWLALGTLLTVFACLWAYLHLSQILVIVMSDLPHRAQWWSQHSTGRWGLVGLSIALFRFLLPFLCLLTRRARRHPGLLAGLAAGMVLGHGLEALWWVAPSIWSAPTGPAWRDLLALVGAATLAITVLALIPRRATAPGAQS